jgi:uncharacterized protein
MRHYMLVPSLSCPASCSYCFGPHAGGEIMHRETVEAVAAWSSALADGEKVELTFHGGEPLTAGFDFYAMALPILRSKLASRLGGCAIQSNLWLLTPELCQLFREHRVAIGTSLDGPEEINDAQRGKGYFQRTMRGVELAHQYGLDAGVICTFTARSAQRADEVFDFFLKQNLSFSIHAALPVLPSGACQSSPPSLPWVLAPPDYGELLVHLLTRYQANMGKIRISTLDALCRSISAGEGCICTFGDCLGEYLAVAPNGDLYTCQRFIGLGEYRLGNVHDNPSWADLSATPVWRMLQERQERITEKCGECAHLEYCRGGCPYNALVAGGGKFNGSFRDPHCPAYQRAFSAITDLALAEVFSQENIQAVVAGGKSKHGLLQKGTLLQIMRGGLHPQELAKQARKVVAAVALASSASVDEAVNRLEAAGLVTDRTVARNSLESLQNHLQHQAEGLLNAYIHATYACNLACEHCYAGAGPGQVGQSMPVEQILSLVQEAAGAGFSKAVITGGEPLAHPQREALLEGLAALRPLVRPLQVVLRTNLAYPLSTALLEKVSRSADQVVVSLDGDQATHDARRGQETYARTVENLRRLVALTSTPSRQASGQECGGGGELAASREKVVLAATLNTAQVNGAAGDAVRQLADELGVGLRFKPVLPLGRAAGSTLAPEFYSSLDEDRAEVVTRAHPVRTCGLGMNLYIAPDGQCYPCYALMGARHDLGNALAEGLAAVLRRDQAYRQVTVDSNQGCRRCGLRYLCGGFCRAWGSGDDPNTPPEDCTALQARVRLILESALVTLDVTRERWLAAKLPVA